MSLNQIHLHKALKIGTLSLGVLTLAITAYVLTGYDSVGQNEPLEARLIPAHKRGLTPWKNITVQDVTFGRTVPPNTYVIIEVPASVDKMNVDKFFGYFGDRIRYWGYVIPDDYEAAKRMRRRGVPGRLFFSKLEREARAERDHRRVKSRIDENTLSDDLWLNDQVEIRGRIRHQTNVIRGGMRLFVHSEHPIPVGLDPDGDNLIDPVEREHGTDPLNPDTDRDGLTDGDEVLLSKTLPIVKDTDGDGITDGVEDKNRNGVVDYGETDPSTADSDKDGLPDGAMRAGPGGKEILGEDFNLNGKVDEGETDPLDPDSDNDGIRDKMEYYNCVLFTDRDCKYSAFELQ